MTDINSKPQVADGTVPAVVGGMRFEVWDYAPRIIEEKHPGKDFFVSCGYAYDSDGCARDTFLDVGFKSRAAASRWCKKNGASSVKHWWAI